MSDDMLRRLVEHEFTQIHSYPVRITEIERALYGVPNIQPMQGKWIMHIDDLFPCESTQECSVCHAEQLINGNDDNFCPSCGAKNGKRGINIGKSKKGIAAVEIVVIIAILAILAAITIFCIVQINNNTNNEEFGTNDTTTNIRLVKGKIVNKYCKIKNNTHQYKLELEDEKDEIMVRYWLEVSEQDYNSYRIGDYYRL